MKAYKHVDSVEKVFVRNRRLHPLVQSFPLYQSQIGLCQMKIHLFGIVQRLDWTMKNTLDIGRYAEGRMVIVCVTIGPNVTTGMAERTDPIDPTVTIGLADGRDTIDPFVTTGTVDRT
ncbi:hypothetical protein ACQCN2_02475, partial [Brevibacillus ginsengisoli]